LFFNLTSGLNFWEYYRWAGLPTGVCSCNQCNNQKEAGN